jgi:pilus assembly protein CpaB
LKNRTALGIICIVLSLIICFGLTPLFNSAVNAQTEIVRVVRDIESGQMITSDMVTTVKVGGYNLPDNVVQRIEDVIGRYAVHGMVRGDYILFDKLSNTLLAGHELRELDGLRQVISITVRSLAAGLSGKLENGDIVTVIVSDFGDFRETIAPPELRYVQIIAVTDNRGNNAERVNEDRELPATVTLYANHQQAVLLAELEAKGRIHLALVYRGSEENRQQFLDKQDEFFITDEQGEMVDE